MRVTGPDLVDGLGRNLFTDKEAMTALIGWSFLWIKLVLAGKLLGQVLGEAEVAVFRPSNFVFLADHPTLRVRNLCPIFLRCRKAGARDGALAILKIDSRF